MEFLFTRDGATVADVLNGIPDPPGYSAVRAMLGNLEAKGFATHVEVGRAYVYRPAIAKDREQRTALAHVVRTMFGNSKESAVTALLGTGRPLPRESLDRLAALIEQARGSAEK
jgi:predicted transcriptional regulator